MTRKHFKALAEAIGSNAIGHANTFAIWEVAESVANVCEDFNPRFDRERFLEAVQKAYDRAN